MKNIMVNIFQTLNEMNCENWMGNKYYVQTLLSHIIKKVFLLINNKLSLSTGNYFNEINFLRLLSAI